MKSIRIDRDIVEYLSSKASYLRGRRRRCERRAYACPHCGGRHLTSQPERRR